MEDFLDNPMLKYDVVLFLIVMVIWDLIRAFFIAWMIPKFMKKK